MKHQLVAILDFAGQNNQMLARHIRGLGVYAEILPYSTSISELKKKNPIGIILAGAYNSQVTNENSIEIESLGVPILGIGYGANLLAKTNGGEIADCNHTTTCQEVSKKKCVLFDDTKAQEYNFNYVQKIVKLGKEYECFGSTKELPYAVFGNNEKKEYGVEFLPEKSENTILKNFLYSVCGAKGDWNIKDFVENQIQVLREKIGDKKVLCAMSGGVDSAVSATLVYKAIGKNLTCVFVDHGCLRKYEAEQVMHVFHDEKGMNIIKIDAEDRFLKKLAGVTEPERKRKIIGEEFIRVFEEFGRTIGKVDYLVQGTIYPDIVESGFGNAHLVKSHHNVGGLPSVIDFKEIIEPLKDLFKDEVRKVGLELGLEEDIVMRQPFPGPGLAIRVIGDLTKEKLDLLRDADFIVRDEIKKSGLYKEIWQYFAVLTNIKNVGVRNDKRTYEYAVALRAVNTVDAMTADFARIPYEVLAKISSRIVNEVEGVNRVLYDITTKPPATIEME